MTVSAGFSFLITGSTPPHRSQAPYVVLRGRATFTLGGSRPDLAAVDELCRLRLLAARHGDELHVRRPCRALAELLTLCGVDFLLEGERSVEVRGQAEVVEQLFVEEAVMPDDAPG